MINVIWQSYHKKTPTRDYWDMAMLEAVFKRELWNPANGHEFRYYDTYEQFHDAAEASANGGAVVILPARYHAEDVDKLNADIANLKWCLVILVGDEEAVFPADKIVHPNMKLWVMTPDRGKHEGVGRLLINGWPPDALKYKLGML
jgi:hypothetical protein